MRQKNELPFKVKTKYVVERKVEGDKTLFWKSDGDVRFEPENGVDNRVASVIDDKDFLLEGYVSEGTFYASDVLYYDGESFREKEWPQRYKVLKNEFRWNSAVKMNRPLVVTSREEMQEAVKLFNLLGNSEGVVIRDYDSSYGDDRVFVPDEEGDLFQMARPVGSREISVRQIRRIVELSLEGENRPDIADEVGVAKRTVWRYQNDFDVV